MKRVHTSELEKQIWELDGVRVSFLKIGEMELDSNYLDVFSKPIDGEVTVNDLALRVSSVVGPKTKFVIIFGDLTCVPYPNSKPITQIH